MLNSLVLNEKEPVSDWGGRGSTLLCGQEGQGIHSSAVVLAWKEARGCGLERRQRLFQATDRQCLWAVRPIERE